MAKQKTSSTSKLARRAARTDNQGGNEPVQGVRLDKWLWCARFYKTRALAVEDIDKGRVQVNGGVAKASRELRVGDLLAAGHGAHRKEVRVLALSAVRGPAAVAQQLYEETVDSIAAREQAVQQRTLAPEPSDALRHGRPTKKDRRDMAQLRDQWGQRSAQPGVRAALDARWSAGSGAD